MTKTLYVGNLAHKISEDRLRDLFAGDGRGVETVKLKIDGKTGKSRGFGFVEMASEEDAAAALLALNDTEVEGRVLKVGKAAREKGATTAKSGGYEDDYGGGGGRFGSSGGGGQGRRR